MLDCESAGWYPDPEVSWLDGEGHVLSAGPTETVRGPDDLYTVSSRVTVDKRHSNSFTCRVQQNHISLTRNSHIHVADNVFVVQSCLTVRVIISLGVCFASVLIVVLIVCRCGHNKASDHHKTEAEFGELLDNNMKIQSAGAATEEKKLLETSERDGRLDKRNSSCDEEIEQVLGKLSEQKTKLKKQRELINSLLLEVNTQIAETKRKLENPASFDRERKQKKRETVKQDLERRKKEHEELLKITQELLDASDEMMIKFKVINKKLDKDE
ncbi:uncharacterized protein LOC121964177 [Plectropomus leopardus]|uniref:uncharacterized protein LOC121964177 n=1 Tax=Plectropomus leopardus TaxID=160734 RepID=UPI001C4BF4D8|nr:uncharacterized protein LOC121964177 [Plectropomus leopardus]